MRSLIYLALRRVLELVVLLGRSGERKEVEILVLRHELSACAGKRDGRATRPVIAPCSPRSAERFRAPVGQPSASPLRR